MTPADLPRCPTRMSQPAWGLYRGPLLDGPDVPSLAAPPLRHKRWIYLGVCAKEHVVGAAVVDLGYAANAFAYVGALDGAPVRAWKAVAAPWQVEVDRRVARWRAGAQELSLALPHDGGAGHLRGRLTADGAAVSFELALTAPFADAPVTCVAPSEPGTSHRWNLTTKDNTLRAAGEVRWGGARFAFEDDAAVADVTDAYPARRTDWHWASLAGADAGGGPVAVNLCALHNDGPLARENVVWRGGVPHGLGAVRFAFDRAAPERTPWTIAGDGVELRFTPAGARRGDERLVVVESRFVQAYGRFSGTVRAGADTLRLDGVAGVVEDHRAKW